MTISRRDVLAMGSGLAALAVAGPAAAAAKYTLRIHTLVKSPHPYNDMAAAMKAEIEEKSGGKIAVKIFDSGQLGQDPAVIGEMAFGTIDMMISTTSNAVQQIPEYGIFTMPYLFKGMDEALAKIGPGTPVHDHFEEVYEKRGVGMKLLALGVSGTRNMSTAKVDVTGPADLKGLKMRTPPSPMDAKTWAAFGMLPVTVAWGELYAAIQTGVAEAMESSLPGYAGSKLYEVAPHVALTQHTLQVNHTSISEVTWKKLPADLQAVVTEAAKNANALGVEKAKGYDAALVEDLQANHGVTVSRPDTQAFMEVLAPMQVGLAKDLDLSDEYALLKA
ncbi:TRAP transporter substrate-binding protein [Pseudooceanicola sp. CBS1P-1]|uniref:DctP family TRAP transporter solute-binding subunit n=1 Tax=Pseudooceanicola albus TaxID=2692189 RepID=A0A6L7G8G4_9RHOB|nr:MULTISPECIES: TRAP transporter substrate-binding protein [Pseudooceanicola]MBT9385949.1 TRAP transporter substrate-binding protein [Pseudooceanicola endophyticus]MXN19630.1 DctP family TRAP transporter solute-binding subunit [Pseudooceanicola albus]